MSISKELLSEVLDKEVTKIKMHHINDEYIYFDYTGKQSRLVNAVSINIYKLAHKNLKQWARLKNVFDIIDWSEEPEQIFIKAEELRNEIN